jgi:hypothetical protein
MDILEDQRLRLWHRITPDRECPIMNTPPHISALAQSGEAVTHHQGAEMAPLASIRSDIT